MGVDGSDAGVRPPVSVETASKVCAVGGALAVTIHGPAAQKIGDFGSLFRYFQGT